MAWKKDEEVRLSYKEAAEESESMDPGEWLVKQHLDLSFLKVFIVMCLVVFFCCSIK